MIDQRLECSLSKASKNVIQVGNRRLIVEAVAPPSIRFPRSIIPKCRSRGPSELCKKHRGQIVYAAELVDTFEPGDCLGIVGEEKMILKSDCGRLDLGIGYMLVELRK